MAGKNARRQRPRTRRVRLHMPDGVVGAVNADAVQAEEFRRRQNVSAKVARYLMEHPDEHVHADTMGKDLGFSRRQVQDAISVTLQARNGFPIDTVVPGHVYMYRTGAAKAPAAATAHDPLAAVAQAAKAVNDAVAHATPLTTIGAAAQRAAAAERARLWEPLGSTVDGSTILRDPEGQMWKAARL